MLALLADIAHGERNWADIMFLIALIVFAIAFVLRVMARAVDAALIALGLTAVAFGWLLL